MIPLRSLIWPADHALFHQGFLGQADNVSHGGQGNDTIYAVVTIDTIYGDGGREKVVFRGRRSQYSITRLTSDGSKVVVSRRYAARDTLVATLYDVELLQFRDGIVSAAFPTRDGMPHRVIVRSR